MAIRITPAGMGLTVGIIVLALVVLGGLFLVKERGEQARREDAIEIAQENLESQSETGTLTPSIDGETENSGTVNEGQELPGNEATEGDDVAVEGASTDESTTEEASPEALPQTGSNDFAALIAVSMLTFATASYIASRRAIS